MSATATDSAHRVRDVRILVIEDIHGDSVAADAVRVALESEGYHVEVALGAADGLRRFALITPSLVLLRTGRTQRRWVELCRHMHAQADVPIIIGFRLESEADATPAFELGVAGYITDPDRLHELVARVRAALRVNPSPISRHVSPADDDVEIGRGRFVAGTLDIEFSSRRVTLAGNPVHLTRLEFDLLELLVSPAGQVHTRQEIIRRLWKRRGLAGSRTLDTHMRRLRLKLEVEPHAPHQFVTVRGVGFRFDPSDQQGDLRSVP